ncbi:hypothetical protein CRG98_013730 [Punica granatum]|uniref:Uncharacterized protein n=1 Tax=Punica granatum TaxID=22663 RepID=A0A2I0KBH2_PUNGR|nr:hypothetical protein CRG98_013730 [Punica granatum]
MDGMGRANETHTRTGSPFPSIDRGVSDSLTPRVSVNRGMTIMPLDDKLQHSCINWRSRRMKGSKEDSRILTRTASNRARIRVITCEYSLDANSIRVTRLGILKLCSEIVVISVFRGSVPKAHRETFVTAETPLGKPSRVPEGRLKLVPRLWWSLGVCRPVLGGRLLVSGAGPGSSVRKGVRERSGCPGSCGLPRK